MLIKKHLCIHYFLCCYSFYYSCGVEVLLIGPLNLMILVSSTCVVVNFELSHDSYWALPRVFLSLATEFSWALPWDFLSFAMRLLGLCHESSWVAMSLLELFHETSYALPWVFVSFAWVFLSFAISLFELWH